MKNENVTVLICCYNEGVLLTRAIKSIENQNYSNVKIIIVNDFSIDEDTNTICRENEKKKYIKVIWHRKNKGLSAARNTGFSAADTNIIIPLDADDELPPNSIEKIVFTFKNNPDASFVFGNYKIINEFQKENIIDCSTFTSKNGNLNPFLLAKNWKLLGTSPCKKKIWENVGGYDIKFTNAVQDVDFWMRVILLNAKGIYIQNNIYNWYVRSSGMSKNVLNIFHINILKKNYKFFIKYGDIHNKTDAYNRIFLQYYDHHYYWQSLKFGILTFLYLNMRSKVRILLLPFFIVCPKLISNLIYKKNAK